MESTLLQLTSFTAVFVSLLLAIFLLTVKSDNKLGNIFLALFLLINAVDMSSFFYHDLVQVGPMVKMIRIEIGSFLKKPFLFFFVLSVLYCNFKLKSKHLVHFIPLLLSSMVLLPRFYLSDYNSKISFFNDHVHTIEGTYSMITAHLQSAFYIVAVFVLLYKYKKTIFQNYSTWGSFNYTWLYQMNVVLSSLFVVALVKNVYKYGDYGEEITGFRLAIILAHLIFISWLVLKAMYAPKFFGGIDPYHHVVSGVANPDTFHVPRQDLDDIEKMEQIKKIKRYMAEHQPYLNSGLTIQDLATQLDIDVRELSILINHSLNQNFYDFVNKYRIDRALEMLKNPKQKKLSILEILYEVGFNSKSSFNTSFKKKTGLTPTEYRIKHLKKL